MAVVLLAFGSMLFGCDVDVNNHTLGKIEVQQLPNTKLLGDTTAVDTTEMLGMIAMPPDTTVVIEKRKEPCHVIIEPPIMGAITMVPDTTVKPEIDTAVVGIKMGEAVMVPDEKKKPVSDTSICRDTGYY